MIEWRELWADADRRDDALLRVLKDTVEAEPGEALLSRRERECLLGASHGLERAQTAEALGLDFETVANYLARARRKLGAKTTTQAVAEALRLGLIR